MHSNSDQSSLLDGQVPPEGLRTVSVIIPALNEEKFLGQCLQSLTRLDFPPTALEVIVVDNGSTDGTLRVARSFTESLNLRIFEKKGASIAALRNLGGAAARGDLLAFLDADCVAPPGWLAAIQEAARTPKWGVIGACYLIPADSPWVARVWYGYQRGRMRGEVSSVGAHNFVVSRSTFQQTGGFDGTLETNEDYELCRAVAAQGLSIIAKPQAAVIHLGNPETLASFFRRERWHGKHVLRVFLRSISTLPNLKAVSFAMYTLLCMTGLAAGVVQLLLGASPVLLASSAVALFAAPALLSLRAVVSSKQWGDFVPLAVLFVTYGIARATCLLHAGDRTPRNRIAETPAA